MARTLTLHPDRLFPSDAQTRQVARRLYDQVKDLPIISPHGHVPPGWIADDVPFNDPTSLLITPDHYVTRMMHASGVDLADLGVAQADFSADQARNAFRIFCSHWDKYSGTPVRYWMTDELVDIFGVDVTPSSETADQIYDTIAAKIAEPDFRPRALMDRFDIAFMATTDDPCDDLSHHAKIAADESFTRTVVPTFRPDKYLEPAKATWNDDIDRLGEVSGVDTSSYAGWVEAMENRRAFFKANGAVSTDHSHIDLGTQRLDDAEAARLYEAARAGTIEVEQAHALRRHFVNDMARMASDDGLTMTLHPAVYRNHHTPTFEKFGADVGADIPISVEVTRAVQPMLDAYGTNPNFTVVLFTLDETVFSRELAPLSGFYPSVHVGVPWWFIDAPDAIKRFRKAATESAGFTRGSGFIDDTRAFLSIPARHDMSRRLDCVHLADLVVEHRLDEDEACDIARQLVVDLPKKVFKL
ncbi:glucuronate isomerase [Aestuariimicrobium ganziense]|uniref:glucuronate isomerase n=1 Tax=Aestuariimicrobium ganziense TaxID=2773677 RepID=UPI0019409667|nr:glucuronate isomerase [Aestuariimicrobium ganziense]